MAAGHYSVLEAERLDEVFSRHGCKDLLAKRHERWMKLMADFSPDDMEAAADRQTESLLALIFAATGFARTAGDLPPGNRPGAGTGVRWSSLLMAFSRRNDRPQYWVGSPLGQLSRTR